jgi:hypothetical protein
MKDQYVGDINDYLKYSLLRALGQETVGPQLVCWMLTEDDGGVDGRKISYLKDPAGYREIDPDLFDALRRIVESGIRTTTAVETNGTLPGSTFFRTRLEDGAVQRSMFFSDLWSQAPGHQIVFFDPDNGLSVDSVPIGRAGSRRYLYCSELDPLVDLDAAAVIYQHFPRVQRVPYVALQLDRLASALPGFHTIAIHSAHVAFLAVAPPRRVDAIRMGFQLAKRRWASRLQLVITEPGSPAHASVDSGGRN